MLAGMISTRTYFLITIGGTWAGLHALAVAQELYWHLWWFDLPMHLVGGVVVALVWLTLCDVRLPLVQCVATYWATLRFVILAVVVWELFEVWAGIPIEADYGLDTAIDVALGLLGGHVGYYLGDRLSAL